MVDTESTLRSPTPIPSSVAPDTSAKLSSPKKQKTFLGLSSQDGLLLLAALMWGVNFVVAKNAVDILPPFVFNLGRYTLGTFFLGVTLKFSGEDLRLPRKIWMHIIGIAILSNVIYQAFFTYGLKNTTVANSVLILTTGPVWVLLYNLRRGTERLGRGGIIGALLALSGVLLVIVGRYAGQLSFGNVTLLGDALTTVAALAWAGNILSSRNLMRDYSVLSVSFWILAWGTFFQAFLAVPDMIHLDWQVFSPGVIISIVYSGICSIFLANIFWNRGLRELGASRTAAYANLQPIIAAVTAIIFLHESFTIWLVFGTGLVLIGMALVRRG